MDAVIISMGIHIFVDPRGSIGRQIWREEGDGLGSRCVVPSNIVDAMGCRPFHRHAIGCPGPIWARWRCRPAFHEHSLVPVRFQNPHHPFSFLHFTLPFTFPLQYLLLRQTHTHTQNEYIVSMGMLNSFLFHVFHLSFPGFHHPWASITCYHDVLYTTMIGIIEPNSKLAMQLLDSNSKRQPL